MDSAIVSIAIHIIGRVQGVGFRAWIEREAKSLGLTGWVGNDPDGSVRAIFSGREEAVTLMIDRSRKGPPLARVDAVITEPADRSDTHYEFRVIA